MMNRFEDRIGMGQIDPLKFRGCPSACRYKYNEQSTIFSQENLGLWIYESLTCPSLPSQQPMIQFDPSKVLLLED